MKYKFAVILNKKIQAGVAINAASHIMASLTHSGEEEDKTAMSFLSYTDADGESHTVSGLPLIVLKANNSNKLKTLREKALDDGLLVSPFFESMTGGTYQEQMERTKNICTENLDFYGVGIFGTSEKVEFLAKKFSLWN